MLHIQDIHKKYVTGALVQEALDGVTLTFRDNEFVAVLGPSGSGKTTLLNIVGGLDRYDSGDLIINGVSTKEYKDRDWDTYRNHSVGFVFQSYNLISHQSILSNVELALTISGISRSERRRRAEEALTQVGLGDQLHKKPNQMSGGQMQRVAIARALVNNPDILLADEPTGALDTQTGLQVMELLKEVAKDRLVIMVTHNPDLAEQYATRIVRLQDGRILSDSNPVREEIALKPHKKVKRASMSRLTSLGLSFHNLMTKKGRTLMTAAAGSIGIIGIALILSLSSGVNTYITDLQKESMASYPITISSTTFDLTSLMEGQQAMMGRTMGGKEKEEPQAGVHSNSAPLRMMNRISSSIVTNDLTAFRAYLEDETSEIRPYIGENGIVYTYDTSFDVYTRDEKGSYLDTSRQLTGYAGAGYSQQNSRYADLMSSMMGQNAEGAENFSQMIPGTNGALVSPVITDSYDLLAGSWPRSYDEVVLVLDEENSLYTTTLNKLGLISSQEMQEILMGISAGTDEAKEATLDYEAVLGHSFYLVTASDYYQEAEDGTFHDVRTDKDASLLSAVAAEGLELKISGIIRPAKDGNNSLYTAVAYTAALTDYIIDHTDTSPVVTAQEAAPDTDVCTGARFTDTTFHQNLSDFGKVSYDAPSSISIYCDSFEDKDKIADAITAYNHTADEDSQITYTDYVALLTNSITSMVNIVSYVLIAFVAVSLIVSCIMISIITQISVLERTKEIGILRAIGASKRNISQVFNAETFIIGITSGLIGVGMAELLTLPINAVIHALTEDTKVNAILPPKAAVALVLISIVITVISGFIPAKKAAKKDPVVALRTE